MSNKRTPMVRRARLALQDRNDRALSPVKATTLVDTVVERLIDYILLNSLHPGAPLPAQRDLAERLVVSRPVLRQAIRQLERDGVVRVRHGSGMWLETLPTGTPPAEDRRRAPETAAVDASYFSHASALAVLEARMTIDVELAALAAERASSFDLVELEEALDRIRAARVRGRPTVSATSHFHQLIARIARSPTLARFYAELTEPMMAGGLRIESALPDVTQHEEENHRSLLDAIRSGDRETARDAMRLHLRKAHHWERFVARLREGRDGERSDDGQLAAQTETSPSMRDRR